MTQPITALYADHVATLQKQAEAVMSELNLNGLAYDAGAQDYFFQDDRERHFKPAHHFAHWVPAGTERHMLVVTPGKKPVLHLFVPDDFWYEPPVFKEQYWLAPFDVRIHSDDGVIWRDLADSGFGYVGPRESRAAAFGLRTNVETLLGRLNWNRCYKTPYEVECLKRATELAAKGHHAAFDEFTRGGSELDIYEAYLRAMRVTENELPYGAIIALDDRASYLHYVNHRDHARNGNVMLIDAGASFAGYGSDITRTHLRDGASPVFAQLLSRMEAMQQQLCAETKPGLTFADHHLRCHRLLAQLLLDVGIMHGVSVDDAMERQLTQVFLPHGLGHMLGIFVHDVGGKQKNPEGSPLPMNRNRYLRNTRVLEPGFVVTIEPGLYFIDMLLKPLRQSAEGKCFDWKLIDAMRPFGGIRIEDDVLVTAKGHENLTRPYLPK